MPQKTKTVLTVWLNQGIRPLPLRLNRLCDDIRYPDEWGRGTEKSVASDIFDAHNTEIDSFVKGESH